MTHIVNVQSKAMAIENFLEWLESGEDSVMMKVNYGNLSINELVVRYPYSSSLPNVEAVTSIVVEENGCPEKNGSWERVGVWFKDKKVFLCTTGDYLGDMDIKRIHYFDVIREMRETFLSRVFNFCHELYPTPEDLTDVAKNISSIMDEELNHDVDMAWIQGKQNTNAKEIFIANLIDSHALITAFDEESAIHWVAGEQDSLLQNHFSVIKKEILEFKKNPSLGTTDVSMYLSAFKKAVLLADKAKKYVGTPKALAAVNIAEAVTAYLKDHVVKKNFKIVCKNSKGEEFTGQIPRDDLITADGIYLVLRPDWKGPSFYEDGDKWSNCPAANQVVRISYKKDIVYNVG